MGQQQCQTNLLRTPLKVLVLVKVSQSAADLSRKLVVPIVDNSLLILYAIVVTNSPLRFSALAPLLHGRINKIVLCHAGTSLWAVVADGGCIIAIIVVLLFL